MREPEGYLMYRSSILAWLEDRGLAGFRVFRMRKVGPFALIWVYRNPLRPNMRKTRARYTIRVAKGWPVDSA